MIEDIFSVENCWQSFLDSGVFTCTEKEIPVVKIVFFTGAYCMFRGLPNQLENKSQEDGDELVAKIEHELVEFMKKSIGE